MGAEVGPSNGKIHHFIHRHVLVAFIDRVRIDELVILLVEGNRSTFHKRRLGVVSGCCPRRLTSGTALTVLLGRNERVRLVSRRLVAIVQMWLLQFCRMLLVLRRSDGSYTRFHEETTFLATASFADAATAAAADTLTALAVATVLIDAVLHRLVPLVPTITAAAAAIAVAVCPGAETR